jgi:hypothetical protein
LPVTSPYVSRFPATWKQNSTERSASQWTEKRGKRRGSRYDLTANRLAGLTISTLGVTFRAGFADGPQDISVTVKQVLSTLGRFATNAE